MYFPSIWSFRNSWKQGWIVYSSSKHHQWENVRVPLVLVSRKDLEECKLNFLINWMQHITCHNTMIWNHFVSGTSLSFAGPQFISFFAWPPSYHHMYVYCFYVIDVDHPTDLISIPFYKNATMVGIIMIYVFRLTELGQV